MQEWPETLWDYQDTYASKLIITLFSDRHYRIDIYSKYKAFKQRNFIAVGPVFNKIIIYEWAPLKIDKIWSKIWIIMISTWGISLGSLKSNFWKNFRIWGCSRHDSRAIVHVGSIDLGPITERESGMSKIWSLLSTPPSQSPSLEQVVFISRPYPPGQRQQSWKGLPGWIWLGRCRRCSQMWRRSPWV